MGSAGVRWGSAVAVQVWGLNREALGARFSGLSARSSGSLSLQRRWS
jgi:hypothetical protein